MSCIAILQKGDNKGLKCDSKVSDESITGKYCGKHLKIEYKTENLSVYDLNKCTVEKLKEICKYLEVKSSGNKQTIINNIKDYYIISSIGATVSLGTRISKNVEKTEEKYKKKPVPQTLRFAVYTKYETECKGKCWCCKSQPITPGMFEYGHIVAEKNGGETNMDNGRPICSLCNRSMGTKNMLEFMKELGFDKQPISSIQLDQSKVLTSSSINTDPTNVNSIQPETLIDANNILANDIVRRYGLKKEFNSDED